MLPWIEPPEAARAVAAEYQDFVFLYSSAQTSYSGRYSYLAFSKEEEVASDDWQALESRLTSNQKSLENAWFGYLSYDLKNSLEPNLPKEKEALNYPLIHMMRFGTILKFDHYHQTLECHGKPWKYRQTNAKQLDISIQSLSSNMTKSEYLKKVRHIQQAILEGDLYQANLTRKFFGEFSKAPNVIELFAKLCTSSPAPFSALLKFGSRAILSSSPESFLSIDTNGHVETRPIKGSAALKDASIISEKNKAENLMIVDLMRNDLSKSCVPSSVKVTGLFDVTEHATLAHLSSTISGQKRKELSTLDVIKGCFPPGSMTGAPKLAAIKLCTELECQPRGIYSGALGWFGGDGSAELSVVIRTLIIEGKKCEFQVGGAITSGSDPQEEWHETLLKAKGIAKTLNLSQQALAAL